MRKRLPYLIGLLIVACLLTLVISNLVSRPATDNAYQVQVPARLDSPYAFWQAAEAWITAFGKGFVDDPAPALDYNQRGLAKAPDNASLLLQQISLGLLTANLQSAQQGAERLLNVQPASFEAQFYYCAIREKSGLDNSALPLCYAQALALFEAAPQNAVLVPTRIFLMTLAEDPRLDSTLAAFLAADAPGSRENTLLMQNLERTAIIDALLAPLYYRVYQD